MLESVIVVAAIWVCPGDLYTNRPREGCRPFEQSGKEGFNTAPEPTFLLPPVNAQQAEATPPPPEYNSGRQQVAPEFCTLYEEYIHLGVKTQSGFLNHSPEEAARWQTLRRMFQGISPPICPFTTR